MKLFWKFFMRGIHCLPVFALMLCACAHQSSPPTSFHEIARADIQEVEGSFSELDGTASLLDMIAQSELQTLVESALENNPGLQQTVLALKKARVGIRTSRADLLPSADFSLEGKRAENENGEISNAYTGSFQVSWQADLWGKNLNALSAVKSDVNAQQLLLQSARDTLAAQVMSSWLSIIYKQHALNIENQRLASYELNEKLVVERYRKGIGTLDDLDSIRTSTAKSRASVREFQESLAQEERSLKTLLGRSVEVSVPEDFPEVFQPLSILPQQNLGRRPDLRAAYQKIQAEELRTRVAYKDLLPSFSIQAALQDTAESPSQALLKDPLWNLLGQLTAPVFRGGALKASLEQQKITTAEAYQAYRETLLTAIQEVDDALGQEQSLSAQQDHIRTALASAKSNLSQYERKYQNGSATILELLTIHRENFDLQSTMNELKFNRLNNRITLALALGLGVTQQ